VWITIIPIVRASVEHAPARRDHRLQRRDVVAERLAEAARLDEVALHVDDDERVVFGSKVYSYGSASIVRCAIGLSLV
jgi:hypothetical protein